MTRIHLIENGVVVNTIEDESVEHVQSVWPSLTVVASEQGGPGWTWNGAALTPPARDVATDKAAQWEAIKAHRDRLSDDGGYKVTLGGVDKWFHSDVKSKNQQLGLLRDADQIAAASGDLDAAYAGPGPGGVLAWKTMDGTFVVMTANVARAIYAAAKAQESALFVVAEQHKAAMEGSANPASYDFSTGWPATFQG